MAEVFLWIMRIAEWAFGAVILFWLVGMLLYSLPTWLDPEARRGGGGR